jgi:hypothetical protein
MHRFQMVGFFFPVASWHNFFFRFNELSNDKKSFCLSSYDFLTLVTVIIYILLFIILWKLNPSTCGCFLERRYISAQDFLRKFDEKDRTTCLWDANKWILRNRTTLEFLRLYWNLIHLLSWPQSISLINLNLNFKKERQKKKKIGSMLGSINSERIEFDWIDKKRSVHIEAVLI